jgi:hypothetical protein
VASAFVAFLFQEAIMRTLLTLNGSRFRGRNAAFILAFSLPFLFLYLMVVFMRQTPTAAAAPGDLNITIHAAFNLIVDSNVSSPSTYAPRVATVNGRFCNSSGSTMTDVYGYIGNSAANTPGVYPALDTNASGFAATYPQWSYLANTGSYAFQHVGGATGTADATRYIGDIEAGQCKVQYWSFTYPACANTAVAGVPVEPPCTTTPTWGPSVKPDDDLSLRFDIWGTGSGGGADNKSWTMTMRNEISAMANKIQPNPDGLWFNTETSIVAPGDVITTNGVLYTLGNIRQGFDNDGDYVPDYNAWLQPFGDPSYDPSCFRLIRSSTVLTISRSSGQPSLILHTDDLNPHPVYGGPLYFTKLPPDNNGVRGEVRYTFLSLSGPCSLPISPYQEVASGADNEKFNGDYGTGGLPPISSLPPEVTLGKSSTPSSGLPGSVTFNYTIPYTNTSGETSAGLTLNSTWAVNMPLVISDTVPAGLQYVAGSAAAGNINPTGCSINCYSIRYSTNSGATWSTTDPGNVTSSGPNNLVVIQWWLNSLLPPLGTGAVTFSAAVPANYISSGGSPVIENCADSRFGEGAPFAQACAYNFVDGPNSIGDFVWADENRDGSQTDETSNGIANITVWLYYDRNGNGLLDATDPLMRTTSTTASATAPNYLFNSLPDGRYIVKVDSVDTDLPAGYTNTTADTLAVPLDPTGTNPNPVNHITADFGFGPVLLLEKELTSINPAYTGELVEFQLRLTNNLPGDGTAQGFCTYRIWATIAPAVGTPSSGTGNQAWLNIPNLLGPPDGVHAYTTLNNSADTVGISGFNLSGQLGTITSVRLLAHVRELQNLNASTSEYLRLAVFRSDVSNQIYTYDGLTYFTGPAGTNYIINQLLTGTWQWSDFQNNLTEVQAIGSGTGNNRGDIGLDAIAYIVTTNQQCGGAASTIAELPLTDIYDATKLAFVASEPPPTTAGGGTITWSNLGPLYAGGSRSITVTFRALATTDMATVNSASVSGAKFATGRDVNDVNSSANVNILTSGSIMGTVWSEINTVNNWTEPTGYDPADTRIPNVTMELWGCFGIVNGVRQVLTPTTAPTPGKDCTDTVGKDPNNGEWVLVATQQTAADGTYAFTGLRPGYYNVKVRESTLPTGFTTRTAEATKDGDGSGIACGACDGQWHTDSANLNTFNVLDSGETITHVSFGYRNGSGNGAITGYVWNDRNDNGVWNTGAEEPILNTTVYLCLSTANPCNAGSAQATTITGPNGFYSFTVAPGNYRIGVLPPAGMSQSGDPDHGPTSCNGAPGCDNQSGVITVAAREVKGVYNFGYTGGLTIGDTVYTDWNGNGSQDSGEEGIAGVAVYLYRDLNGNGVIDADDPLIGTQTTDNNGFYEFTNLAGNGNHYIVRVIASSLPAGYVQTADPDESGACTVCNNRASVTLTTASVDTVDFGYRPRGFGSIGDFVWFDNDADRVQDSGEPGVANVLVHLYQDEDGDGVIDAEDALVATTTTNSNGLYTFSNLAAANYIVQVVASNFNSGQPLAGYSLTNSGAPYHGSQRSYRVTLGDSLNFVNADFGFAAAAIGDRIFWDANGNGEEDWNETGIPDVTVWLYAAASNGAPTGPVLATTTSDGNGYYLFSSLVAGDYVVVVDTNSPNLVGRTLTSDPDNNGVPCDPNPSLYCDSQTAVMGLFLGQPFLGADFGYRPLGAIGDTLWIDADNDGVRNGNESGIANITIWLCSALPCSGGTILQTTTTDPDGYYSFSNLSVGTYYVHADTADPDFPAGLNQTYDPDGIQDSTTAVIIDSNGMVTHVGGTACSNCSLDVDFGYRYTGVYSISGTIFFDAGGDGGTYNSLNDTPYANITVYLWRNGVQIAQTVTVADGSYSFDDLPNGTYTVAVDSNDQLVLMSLTASVNPTSPLKNFNSVTINNASITQQDFGFYAEMDFGDLPEAYNMTRLGNDGARHLILPDPDDRVYLGATLTAKADGCPDLEASCFTSDDGVTRQAAQWVASANVSLNVTVSGGSGYLVGWFDWNNDGDFNDLGEVVIFGTVPQGAQVITLTIPAGYVTGTTVHTRFRLYAEQPDTISQFGLAINGEVEDYKWEFSPTAVTLRSVQTSTAGPQAALLTAVLFLNLATGYIVLLRRPEGDRETRR